MRRRRRSRTATPSSPAPTRRRSARPATQASTTAPRARCGRRSSSIRATPRRSTQRGALELSRHDFRDGLRDALSRPALAPLVDKPFGVLVDALVELGRYGAGAARAAGDGRPQARPRRLRARVVLPRAARRPRRARVDALVRALSAGGEAAENVAYVDTLLSHVDLLRGRLDLAAREAREALARFPGYPAAGAALARVQVARGDLRGAIRRLRGVVARLPLPEHVIALGETQQAAGHARAGAPDARARRRRAAAPGRGRRQHRRRAGDLRGRSRLAEQGPVARARGVGGRAERALRGRARLGADARRATGRRACAGRAGRSRSAARDPAFLAHAALAGDPRCALHPRLRSRRAVAAAAQRSWSDEAPARSCRGVFAFARDRVRASAGQLLHQPPGGRLDRRRRRARALRARPGGDPDVPGARAVRGRRPGAQARRGAPRT